MNKKGMTLIELMAVIAILGILSVMIVPSFTTIRTKMLKSSLDSKIDSIKSAALEYANNNYNRVPSILKCTAKDCESIYNKKDYDGSYNDECLLVKVGALVGRGYLVGDDDDKEVINNPVTSKSLNNELVCVRFDSENARNRKLEAFILKEDALYEDE